MTPQTAAPPEPRAADKASGEPAVRLDHVSKAFGEKRVLDDVSFEVPAGCGFVILGRSGTGKSVTLRHIIGLVRPDKGKVFVEADEISALEGRSSPASGARWASSSRTPRCSTRSPSAKTSRSRCGGTPTWPTRKFATRAQAKLASVGLEKEYEKMPGDLSGGMRKRAGLARALALDPTILLVDEPSAGLDPITADEIDQLLLGLKEQGGVTLIIVTHNIPSARRLGDQLLMLHEGRIVASGSPEELDESDNEIVRAFLTSRHAG